MIHVPSPTAGKTCMGVSQCLCLDLDLRHTPPHRANYEARKADERIADSALGFLSGPSGHHFDPSQCTEHHAPTIAGLPQSSLQQLTL